MAQNWNPTALEMMQAMMAIYTLPEQTTPAIFIHGSPIRSDELDEMLCNEVIKNHRFDQKIVLNGLTAKQCKEKHIAYGGWEMWGEMMEGKVDSENIILIPPSGHTGAESRNLLALANEKKWSSITIASYPHHILRCFLQIIALMPQDNVIKVNPLTFNNMSWNQSMEKPVMIGGTVLGAEKDIVGDFQIHIQGEFERIVAYGQEPPLKDGLPTFTRNATFSELFNYLKLVY